MADAEAKRRHSQSVLLRLTPDQLDLMDQAAEHAGLSRTGWMRATLLRVAREEIGVETRRPSRR